MSSNDDYTKHAVDRIWEAVQKNGVSASTVSDGTVLLFTRKFLEMLLEKHSGQETISIHVQTPKSN